ncbi:hypothetical protein [Anthocerotibacter panamensis]|uniref:hypothetical protein n=1 Tax=Anthocerotibacter panamensis TaxID=2857077 RepID=UPI001C4063B0|nr:hypothetical protein [Anthocerotibacter panamensis]
MNSRPATFFAYLVTRLPMIFLNALVLVGLAGTLFTAATAMNKKPMTAPLVERSVARP